eukprot:5237097-Amphidinium_carterae.1
MPRAGAEACKSCGAAPAVWLAAGHARLENAAVASTWHAKHTWSRRCVSIESYLCAHAIRTLTSSQERISPGCATSGTEQNCIRAWLDRPNRNSRLVVNKHLQRCRPGTAMARTGPGADLWPG